MKTAKKSYNDDEIRRFNALADDWWNEDGPMKPLHAMNPVRLTFIRDQITKHLNRPIQGQRTLKNLQILDIGCGGGLLCEPLARLGGKVTGLDLSENLINIAQTHATAQGLKINYQCADATNLLHKKKRFDIVTALEVIEHVPSPTDFIKTASDLLKPNGLLFLSTLNRTPSSYLTAIMGAEYILRWLPIGTHDWRSFIKPSELKAHTEDAGCTMTSLSGMSYNPIKQTFSLTPHRLNVNYILCAQKND